MEAENTVIDKCNSLRFTRKKQSNTNNNIILSNENFFLNPSIEIKLHNPKIIEINSKYIVFKYDPQDEVMLKEFSNNIIERFKNSVVLDEDTVMNPLCTQYIRCTLAIPWSPYKKTHYRYTFDFYDKNQRIAINSDNIKNLNNYELKKIIIEVKNIWKSFNKYGFNCVLKEIHSN